MDKVLFKKVFNPFKAEVHNGGKKYQVFFSAEVEHLAGNEFPYCAIDGVHGANCHGGAYSCGQNIDDFVDVEKVFNKGWNQDLYLEFIEVWHEFHLKKACVNDDIYNAFIKALEKFPLSTNRCAWRKYNNSDF